MNSRDYVTTSNLGGNRQVKVFNLCSDIGYQQMGYYVSLLAEARGHKVTPGVATLRDFNDRHGLESKIQDLQPLIEQSLSSLQSDTFLLSIYFSRNLAKRYDKLCSALYGLFPAPLMRASFSREAGVWRLKKLQPLALRDVPENHYEFLHEALGLFVKKKKVPHTSSNWRYDLAILVNPKEKTPPSDEGALKAFAEAAQALGMHTEFIQKQDSGRLREFDALFIRETTQVNHHTYRFARRAQAEGLVVIDDPESILRCTNKVYLAELMARNKVSIPKPMIVHRHNRKQVAETIGLPCILKEPDSSFSQGVYKTETLQALDKKLTELLDRGPMVIAQEYMPTEFDWRIGIIDRKPFYASKYFMAKKHWQIRAEDGDTGEDEAIPVGWVPKPILQTAVKAANLIGDGFYGVDVKEVNGKPFLIEVNDNPSIDAGIEDGVLRDELYTHVMTAILNRIEVRKRG
jgi:glutathione synthase/RimK-type ligase-like ATP-grasp enzyme